MLRTESDIYTNYTMWSHKNPPWLYWSVKFG